MLLFVLMIRLPPISTLFPYTTLFRSVWLQQQSLCCQSRKHGPANWPDRVARLRGLGRCRLRGIFREFEACRGNSLIDGANRSEEHTSELQSHVNLVCRLLLEKKKNYS